MLKVIGPVGFQVELKKEGRVSTRGMIDKFRNVMYFKKGCSYEGGDKMVQNHSQHMIISLTLNN